MSDRVEQYRQEVQSLIKQGVEHPRFEFKRSCSISRDSLDDRLDFVRLLQGVANAEVTGERYITIGADPKERQFYPVSNTAEFDPAAVASIVAKYLDPPPRFQVFNSLLTDGGQPFVLFVLDENQPRPIAVKTEGQRQDGRSRLQVGEIWIKKGTALQPASRSDLDLMYRQRMEEEAEDRARKRFKHFSELPGAPHPPGSPPIRLPVRELLVGPASEFRRFTEELIAVNDYPRFRMLVELARESLVEGWDNLNMRERELLPDPKGYVSEASGFFRDEFLPSLQSVVTLGLLVIKYDFEANWLLSVADMLLEAFESSRGLQRLKYATREPGSLRWWRPAFEIYVALRTIATYALSRNRPRFLAAVLPRLIARITPDDRKTRKTPVLLWPLPPNLFTDGELSDGRSTFYWKERVSTAWGKYFGAYERFLGAACELELLLELNSYVGTNVTNDPEIAQWQEVNGKDVFFDYNPDLFAYDLDQTVPMAERLYDVLAADKPFPAYLTVDPRLLELAFKGKNREQRLLIYGGFLHHLQVWQERAMFQQFHNWPFMHGWEGRLGEIVEKYERQLPKRA
ncbi:MAG: hypothetical protein WCA49_03420 [Candidatus Sulfotelmatobacter sp.]